MHPSARLRGAKSGHLKGRRIVLGVSGSIAAVESVRVAHELIRHGAEVIPVMTPSAATLITPLALEFATGRAPVVHLSGRGEHVEWMDGPRRADLLLLAPATANTIAKIALGIDDTALTSFASVALGAGVPIVLAPAMHAVMEKNTAVEKRLRELKEMGVHVVEPRREEEKAKLATPEDLAEACIHRLAKGPWTGKRVLIISGSTAEPVDPIRVLTNRSTGRMGTELATACYRRGARVSLWNAWGSVPLPTFADVRRFETVRDALRLCESEKLSDFDAIFVPAALSDFAPEPSKAKIHSDNGPATLKLKQLPKVLKTIRRRAPKAVLVAFKAESDPRILLKRAEERRREYGVDVMVANTARAFGAASAEAFVVTDRGRPRRLRGAKEVLAERILDAAAPRLRR